MSLDYLFNFLKLYKIDNGDLTADSFSTKITRDFAYTEGSKRLFIFLPTWTDSIKYLKRTREKILQAGDSFLAYDFPDAMLSDDCNLTRDCFKEAEKIVRDEIKDLKNKYSFSNCVLFGVSLGGVTAQMIANNNPDINEMIVITDANCLAESLWIGCRTQALRRSYEKQGITLSQLKNYWKELAPENNLGWDGLKVTIYLSKADRVIPYKLAKVLVKKIAEKAMKPRYVIDGYRGHYLILADFYLFPEKFFKF